MSIRNVFTLAALVLIGGIFIWSQGQDAPAGHVSENGTPLPAGVDASLENLFRETTASPQVPSLAVAVGRNGNVIGEKAYGYADLELKAAATPRSLYRIASISKVIATAALAKMIERGEIDIDANVRTYVPSFPAKRWPITIRQLAAHLAGVRSYNGDEMLISRPYESVTAGLEVFQESPLMWEPGSKYHYSTYGWNLISAAMVGAADKAFLNIVQDDVIEPLNLHETKADKNRDLIANRVGFYTVDDEGQIGNAPYVDNSYKWAGGGYLMSMADTVRFAMFHDEAGYLQASTLDALFTPMKLNDGSTGYHGIGWVVGFDRYFARYDNFADAPDPARAERILAIMKAHNHAVMHSGGAVGGISMMILDRECDLAVGVTRNSSGRMDDGLASPLELAVLTLGAFADADAT